MRSGLTLSGRKRALRATRYNHKTLGTEPPWPGPQRLGDLDDYLISGGPTGNMSLRFLRCRCPTSPTCLIGRALLGHAAQRAASDGMPALTLTTFEHVPWNAPYYARLGFRILDDAEVTPGLRAIRQREAEIGLDRWPRVCMRHDIAG